MTDERQNIPIPGSTNPERVKDNTESAKIKLTTEDLEGINKILKGFEKQGGRYPDSMHAHNVSCHSLDLVDNADD